MYTTPEGLRRTRLNTEMDGMSVFSFGITKAPQSFNLLMERFSLDRESWGTGYFELDENVVISDLVEI